MYDPNLPPGCTQDDCDGERRRHDDWRVRQLDQERNDRWEDQADRLSYAVDRLMAEVGFL